MGRFILIYSHVLILLVHVQMSLALFLNECPDKLMWTLRAKQLCGVEDKYMCLYDTNARSFRELCKDAPEFHRPGNVFVISGNLQYFAGRRCIGNRYQPHKWWTNGSSECQYLKSACNGEGQVPYDNGTITSDRKCRCDYTNYYTFVSSTRNKCHCDPIVEDCSCFTKRCLEDQVLTPDYDCVGIHEWTGRFICPEYKQPKITGDKQGATLCPTIQKDSYGKFNRSYVRISVSVVSSVLVIVGLIIIACITLNKSLKDNVLQDIEKMFLLDYFLEDPCNVECIEGAEAVLTCKVRPESPCAQWTKDGMIIKQSKESKDYKMTNELGQCTLQITKTKRSDNGKYYVFIGKFSRAIHLKIIDYFLEDPLDFECKEGEDILMTCKIRCGSPPVKWLKDGINILSNKKCTYGVEDMEHTLRIKNTTSNDGGKYVIKVGQFSRNIQLHITGYFLEDPNDVTCKIGEDAILTCTVRSNSPSVLWSKDSKSITENIHNEISREVTQCKLKLIKTKPADRGEYIVTVENSTRKIMLNIKEIPNTDERNKYMKAIDYGTEIRDHVRIHVVGKDRVGKTSLIHRLLGYRQHDGTSTDGIEIHRNCQIRKSDGEWIVSKVEKKNRKEMIRRVQQAVNMKQKEEETAPSLPLQKIVIVNSDHNDSVASNNNQDENKCERVDTVDSNTEKTSTKQHTEIPDTEIHLKIPEQMLDFPEHIAEEILIQMDDILSSVKGQKDTMTSDGLVECGIWDFAGQKDYYVTHQTFFTPHAIYLLVADVSDAIQAYRTEEANFEAIGEYIDFWFDSIHCFCTNPSAMHLYPPVIMVCTGTDKCKKVEETKREYERRFLQTFGKEKKVDHRRGIYFISNKYADEKEIKSLKKHISHIATEMNFFSEKHPTRWIHLEIALEVLKDIPKSVCSWRNIVKLAQENSIEENELVLFLNYHHKIGNIIFFNDKPDYIILQPNWLVKCFRCLVCDDWRKHCSSTNIFKLRIKGELSDTILDELFEKEADLNFREYKPYILDVMEKFDIIVKPQFLKNDNKLYYMPCMIETSSSLKEIKGECFTEQGHCTPWLVLEFEFLPVAYYNHILFAYIRQYTVCEEESGHPAIYKGKAVVYLDETESKLLIVCFSKNVISLQIWEWERSDANTKLYKNVLNDLCDKIYMLEYKLNQNLHYKIKAKCSTGDYSQRQGRISCEELGRQCNERYRCKEHMTIHNKDEIENTWLKHAPSIEREMLEKRKQTPKK